VILKKCHAYEISFTEVTQGGKSPPRVTLIIYKKNRQPA